MKLEGKKVLVVYLTDWQQKMVKDFLGIECHTWIVPADDTSNTKYGIRIQSNPEVKKMYLTDWQIREMKQELGVACNFIELEKGVHTLYGTPFPEK